MTLWLWLSLSLAILFLIIEMIIIFKTNIYKKFKETDSSRAFTVLKVKPVLNISFICVLIINIFLISAILLGLLDISTWFNFCFGLVIGFCFISIIPFIISWICSAVFNKTENIFFYFLVYAFIANSAIVVIIDQLLFKH